MVSLNVNNVCSSAHGWIERVVSVEILENGYQTGIFRSIVTSTSRVDSVSCTWILFIFSQTPRIIKMWQISFYFLRFWYSNAALVRKLPLVFIHVYCGVDFKLFEMKRQYLYLCVCLYFFTSDLTGINLLMFHFFCCCFWLLLFLQWIAYFSKGLL